MHDISLAQILKYEVYYFDCDGVLLDTNQLKGDIFGETVKNYGPDKALELKRYHQENPGLSRQDKYTFFLTQICPSAHLDSDLKKLMEQFHKIAKNKVYKAHETAGLRTFLSKLSRNAPKFVVSMAQEDELKEILMFKGLDIFFNNSYGGPKNKDENLRKIFQDFSLPPQKFSSVFFGDSKNDYLTAQRNHMDFIFCSDYTDQTDWREYFKNKPVFHLTNFSSLF